MGTDPQVVLAVWLSATMEGIGSARAIDRLCQQHAAYRWLCGGAPIKSYLLARFRRENAATLDRLLSQSLTGLIAKKLITLEKLMIDGTKMRARAGLGSMSKRKRLERIEKAVSERIAELKVNWTRIPLSPSAGASSGLCKPPRSPGVERAGGHCRWLYRGGRSDRSAQ